MTSTETISQPDLNYGLDQRVLIAAPMACDAEVLARTLTGAGIEVGICTDLYELCRQIEFGAAAAILAEEVLTLATQPRLADTLQGQPEWSDFPLIMMATAGESHFNGWELLDELQGCGHSILLQRPVRKVTLLSAVRAAIQSRGRQYQVRDELLQRRRAEQALRESEERYRTLLGLLPVAVYSCQAPAGTITYFNELAVRLWGRTPTLGDTDERFCGPLKLWKPKGGLVPHEQTPMALALREGREFRNEDVIIERPDGSCINVLVNIDPVRDAQGRVTGAINAFHDVSALRKAQGELADFFENASVGLHWVGPDGTILRANQAELEMLSYERDEYVGQSIIDFHVDKDVIADVLRCLSEGQIVRDRPARMRRKDGTIRDVLINSTALFEDGRFIHTRCCTLDITDWKRAQDALKESEQRFRLMADSAPVLIWMSGPDQEGVYFNQPWLDFTGIPLDEQMGDGWLKLVHPDDRQPLFRTCAGAFHKQSPFATEFRLRRADEQYRWLLNSGSPRFDPNGCCLGFIGSCVDITDRKRAEQALRESERRMSTLVSNLPGMAYRCLSPSDWAMEFVSDGVTELSGYDPADLKSGLVSWAQIVHPEDSGLVWEAVQEGVRNRRPYRMEYRILHKDGSHRWVLEKGEGILDGADEVIALEGFIFDITAGKKAEETRAYLAAIVESTADAVVSKTLDGLITSWNAGAERLFGYSAAEAIGQPIAMIVPPDRRDEEKTILSRLRKGERVEHFETVRRTRHGKQVDVSLAISPIRDPSGRVIGASTVARDISERNRAEAALRESEERFRMMADAAPVMIWIADTKKHSYWFNQPWLDFTGRPMEEEISRGWAENVHADDYQRCLDTYLTAFDAREPFRMEYRLLRHDGEYRWVLDHGIPLYDGGGQFTGYIGSCIDITDRKQTEAALLSREAELDLVARTTPLILARCSRDLRYLFANRSAAALYGLTPDQLIGRSIVDVMSPETFEFVKPYIDQVLQGTPVEYEAEIPTRDCGLRWMRINYLPDRDENGVIAGWVASLADITDLKLAQQTLNVRARQQQAVAALGEFALRERDPDRVLGKATAVVAETLGVEYCEALQLLPGGHELLLRTGVGWKEGLVGRAKVGTGMESQAGFTLAASAPVIVADMRQETRFSGPTLLTDHGVVSGISCVIPGTYGHPWGVFGAHATRAIEFNEDDISFMLAVANILGSAIQRKRVEQALRESEERFRELANNIDNFAWTCDENGAVTWYNRRWFEYTGTTLEQMKGWGWTKVHHPAHVDRVVKRIQHSFETGEPWEDLFPLRGLDGTYRWFLSRAQPIRGADGKVVRWFGTNTDVTEQRQAEEALRESEERVRMAVESTGLGTWDFNPVSGELLWSVRCKEIFGLSPDAQVNYEVFRGRLHPGDRDRTDQAVRRALDPQGPGSYEVEYRSLLPDDSVRWIAARGRAFFKDEGSRRLAYRFMGTVLDITEQKRHEEQMRSVMAELNHRVKNSIATIDAVAQQTVEYASNLEEFRSTFSARLRSMAAAHSLLTRTEWQGSHLRDILLAELRARIPSPDHLVLEGPAVLIKPNAALSLHMALHELTTNASKYGALSVPDGRVHVHWRIGKGDHGQAMLELVWKEHDGPPVAEPRSEGFGSQLVRDVVEYELNGVVERSFASDGVCCRISIDLAEIGRVAEASDAGPSDGQVRPLVARSQPARYAADPTARGLRILVVEDSFSLGQQLARNLESAGCRVIGPAADMEKAVQLWERHGFDAALLDVDLKGNRVYPLAEKLDEKGIPFALLTGFNVDDLPPALANRTIFSKPVEVNALQNWLNAVGEGSVS